jgi:hypothetical protein
VFRGRSNKKGDFQDVLIPSPVAISARDYLFSVTVIAVLTVFSLAGWSGLIGQLRILWSGLSHQKQKLFL